MGGVIGEARALACVEGTRHGLPPRTRTDGRTDSREVGEELRVSYETCSTVSGEGAAGMGTRRPSHGGDQCMLISVRKHGVFTL